METFPYIHSAPTRATVRKIDSTDPNFPTGQLEALTNDGTVLVTFLSMDYKSFFSAKWKSGQVTKLEPGYQWTRMNDRGQRIGFKPGSPYSLCYYDGTTIHNIPNGPGGARIYATTAVLNEHGVIAVAVGDATPLSLAIWTNGAFTQMISCPPHVLAAGPYCFRGDLLLANTLLSDDQKFRPLWANVKSDKMWHIIDLTGVWGNLDPFDKEDGSPAGLTKGNRILGTAGGTYNEDHPIVGFTMKGPTDLPTRLKVPYGCYSMEGVNDNDVCIGEWEDFSNVSSSVTKPFVHSLKNNKTTLLSAIPEVQKLKWTPVYVDFINNRGDICAWMNSEQSLPYNFPVFLELGNSPLLDLSFALPEPLPIAAATKDVHHQK